MKSYTEWEYEIGKLYLWNHKIRIWERLRLGQIDLWIGKYIRELEWQWKPKRVKVRDKREVWKRRNKGKIFYVCILLRGVSRSRRGLTPLFSLDGLVIYPSKIHYSSDIHYPYYLINIPLALIIIPPFIPILTFVTLTIIKVDLINIL